MTAAELFRSLEEGGVTLLVEGDQLRFRGSKKRLTPGVVEALREQKEEVLRLLRAAPSDRVDSRENNAASEGVTLPPAYELRVQMGWSIERFAAFCRELLGRPGPATDEQDVQVAQAMSQYPRSAK